MFDIFPQMRQKVAQGERFAIATVIKTWGSAPRPVGSAMAVSEQGEMIGSVSGGCVEGAVVKEALEILKSQEPKKLKFGVTDEDAWNVGLSCGGAIHVLVEPFMAFEEDEIEKEIYAKLASGIQNNEGLALVTPIGGNERNQHLLVDPEGANIGHFQEEDLVEAAMQAYRQRINTITNYEGKDYFVQIFPRKSQLIIVGAAHITTDLVRLGKLYDFETIVVDPRGIFAEKTQFPEAPDQLINDWPAEVFPGFKLDEYSYAVLLTHDPKIDDQALNLLLRSGIGYIGALGSRRTHAKRVDRLTKAGFSEEEIARIHGPVGVDINAKRPKEIALSIIAEIIKVQNEFR